MQRYRDEHIFAVMLVALEYVKYAHDVMHWGKDPVGCAMVERPRVFPKRREGMATNPLALVVGGILILGIAYVASQVGQDLIQAGVQQALKQSRQRYLTG